MNIMIAPITMIATKRPAVAGIKYVSAMETGGEAMGVAVG
jgi:hypothetical protein